MSSVVQADGEEKITAQFIFPEIKGDKTKSRFYIEDEFYPEETRLYYKALCEEINEEDWRKEVNGFWPERGRAD
jgi:hypothetical protein